MNLINPSRTPDRRDSVDLTRWSVIGLLVIAGLAHIPVIPEHLKEAPYMGVLFILFTVTALTVAGALARSSTYLTYAIAVGLCASAIGAYVATRLVAFPQLSDDVGAWMEPLGLLSIAAEATVVALGTSRAFSLLPRLHAKTI
jgi:uncharacterized membrane protein HdeD (DUF308 family)